MNKKLKIAIVNDAYFPHIDGVTMVVKNYIEELSKNHDVTLIVPRPAKSSKDWEKYYENIPCKVVFCRSSKLKFQGIPVPIPRRDKKFKETISKMEFDVVHTHSFFGLGKYMVNFANKRGILSVNTIHTQYEYDFKRYGKLQFIVNIAMKAAVKTMNKHNVVINLNQKMEDKFKAKGLKTNLEIVPNGSNFCQTESAESLKQLALESGINLSENNLLFVGRLINGKGICFIAKALKHLKDMGTPFKMYFVGAGIDEPDLRKKINKLGLENDCVFLGKITDQAKLQAVYAAAKLFLLPSFYDVDPLVRNEAASFNVPTVFLEGTVCSSGAVDGENGFVVENSDLAYAKKIKEVLEDEKLRKKAGENARKTFCINWEQSINNAYNIYLKYLEKKQEENS